MRSLCVACVILTVVAEARSQSTYTYNHANQVLVDNATGLQWQCGYGLQWSYNAYFACTYDFGKDIAPGVYASSPYGAPGGWRMPTTAELIDASHKGLLDEQFLVALMLGIASPEDDWSWWPFWGVDPKTNKRNAYWVVLATGQKRQVLRAGSTGYLLLVR